MERGKGREEKLRNYRAALLQEWITKSEMQKKNRKIYNVEKVETKSIKKTKKHTGVERMRS